MDKEIVKIEPGFVEASYGLAVDIGTTTCVGYLTDLNTGKVVNTESMMNPQVPYGEDVMSRITYAMSNPGVGLETMQKAIIQGLNEIIERVVKDVAKDGPNPGYVIDDLTIVFNTAMHHIFLGLNPEYIGRSPFIPAVQSSLDIKARDLGLRINPAGYIHVLPIEAGFVGADNVGVLIAEEPYNQDENVLIIDIGTNGELLMGNRNKVCSTSCATGPAFEGAQIKFGMRAAPGAIEKVEIDPETKEARYKVIGKDGLVHTAIEQDEHEGPLRVRHHPDRCRDVQGRHHRQVRQVRHGPRHPARQKGRRRQTRVRARLGFRDLDRPGCHRDPGRRARAPAGQRALSIPAQS